MMSKYKGLYTLLSLMAALLLLSPLLAQEVDVVIDRKQIRIGERAELRLSVAIPKDNPPQVRFPVIGDTLLRYIEVLHTTEVETLSTGSDVKETRLEQKVYITSFDTGFYAIPPFTFDVDGNKASTQAFLFEVTWVAEADTSRGPYDIKEIYEVELGLMNYLAAYWPYILGGMALVGVLSLLILLLLHHMSKRRAQVPPPAPEPLLAPHEQALKALQHVHEQSIYKRKRTKQYYTDITDALRDYLEGAFNIPAHELTTRQIMARLRYADLPQGASHNLNRILQLADMVKFAKEQPDDAANEQAVLDAITFVKNVHSHLQAVRGPVQESEGDNLKPDNPQQV